MTDSQGIVVPPGEGGGIGHVAGGAPGPRSNCRAARPATAFMVVRGGGARRHSDQLITSTTTAMRSPTSLSGEITFKIGDTGDGRRPRRLRLHARAAWRMPGRTPASRPAVCCSCTRRPAAGKNGFEDLQKNCTGPVASVDAEEDRRDPPALPVGKSSAPRRSEARGKGGEP